MGWEAGTSAVWDTIFPGSQYYCQHYLKRAWCTLNMCQHIVSLVHTMHASSFDSFDSHESFLMWPLFQYTSQIHSHAIKCYADNVTCCSTYPGLTGTGLYVCLAVLHSGPICVREVHTTALRSVHAYFGDISWATYFTLYSQRRDIARWSVEELFR